MYLFKPERRRAISSAFRGMPKWRFMGVAGKLSCLRCLCAARKSLNRFRHA